MYIYIYVSRRLTVHIHPSPALILSLFDLMNFHLCQASLLCVSLKKFEDEADPTDPRRSLIWPGTNIIPFLEAKTLQLFNYSQEIMKSKETSLRTA